MFLDVTPPPLDALLYEMLLASEEAGRVMAAQLGVGVNDATALQRLLTHGPEGPVDLGRALGIGSAAATILADRLERAGHVERRPHPDDRRRLQLVPTAHAEREAQRVIGPLLLLLQEAVGEFGEQDLVVIGRFLTAVTGKYRAFTQPGTAPAD